MLRFSDGVNLDTSGPLRAVELHDGWYVLGDGMSIPVTSKEEAEETIRQMTEKKGDKPTT
jgi:hypothetical protein